MTVKRKAPSSDVWHRINAQHILAKTININNINNLMFSRILFVSHQVSFGTQMICPSQMFMSWLGGGWGGRPIELQAP